MKNIRHQLSTKGPMETVEIRRDLDSVPITEHVQVYHSGRSDEPGPGLA